MDEPESALSIKNQFILAKEIKKLPKRNVQVIIATHCFPIIQEIGEVYSLEHKQWMSAEEFIELSKK